MLDTALLSSIATQMMANETAVEVQGKSVPIRRTSSQHLKTVTFAVGGRKYTAIEQNPDKPSRWVGIGAGPITRLTLVATDRSRIL